MMLCCPVPEKKFPIKTENWSTVAFCIRNWVFYSASPINSSSDYNLLEILSQWTSFNLEVVCGKRVLGFFNVRGMIPLTPFIFEISAATVLLSMWCVNFSFLTERALENTY